MNSINFGHSFTLPFESDNAIFARILQCNPASSLYRINIMLKNADTPEPTIGFPTFNRAAESRLMAHYLQSIEDNHLAPPDSPTYSYTTGVHYNCPDCAYALYHTRIYDKPWFNFCEIHRKKIVMRCPECSQPWPVLLVDLNRKCSFCGVKKELDEFIKARKSITPQSLDYLKQIDQQLRWLQAHGAYWPTHESNLNHLGSDTGIGTNDNLLLVLNSLNKHSFGTKQFKTSLKDNFNYYSFSLLSSSNEQRDKKLADKNREQFSFLNHPDYVPELNALVTQEPSHIHNARIEALSDIFLKHAVSIENFDWEELYISDGVCEERPIFTETLSLWLYFILVPDAKYSINHKEAYCPGYFCFQNDWLPHVPQPYSQLQNIEQTHELRPKDVTRLYRFELLTFFDELYWHIDKLTELFKERNNVYTTIHRIRRKGKSVAKANRPILVLNQGRGIIFSSKEKVCKNAETKNFKDNIKKTPLFYIIKIYL